MMYEIGEGESAVSGKVLKPLVSIPSLVQPADTMLMRLLVKPCATTTSKNFNKTFHQAAPSA